MKAYQKGEIIFRQGDPAQSMFSIVDGRVGIYLDYGTKDETLLKEYGSGSYFGEIELIEARPCAFDSVDEIIMTDGLEKDYDAEFDA